MPHQLTRRLLAAALSLSLALALALASTAAAREYEVEVIVFDRLDKDITPHEQWDFSSPRTAERLHHMSELAEAASTHHTSDLIHRLAPVRTHLLESGYRILDTTRWRQPPSFYQHAPLIPLGNRGNGGDGDHALAAGFVRIYTTSLIYADLNLQLSPPPPAAFALPDAAATATAMTANPLDDLQTQAGFDTTPPPPRPHYFITEKRRLKFKQIHYFDHPLFGAILGVWPVDTQTPAVEQTPAGEFSDF